jgi:hypothetical protein
MIDVSFYPHVQFRTQEAIPLDLHQVQFIDLQDHEDEASILDVPAVPWLMGYKQ